MSGEAGSDEQGATVDPAAGALATLNDVVGQLLTARDGPAVAG